MTKRLFFIALFLYSGLWLSAQTTFLSVEKIMQDPKWMGTFPSDIKWDDQSNYIYFNYNPENDPADSLYRIAINNPNKIEKVNRKTQKELIPFGGNYNRNKTQKVYVIDNKLKLYNITTRQERDLMQLSGNISNPVFLADESLIAFQYSNNAYSYNLQNGSLKK